VCSWAIRDRERILRRRFAASGGIPDHAPQHAPDHAAQNPTAKGSWGLGGGGGAADWPAPSQSTGGGGRSGPYLSIQVDPHKSVNMGIVLALILGPLGLFYVSFLSGLMALFVVIPLARAASALPRSRRSPRAGCLPAPPSRRAAPTRIAASTHAP
jgi:hypothetical protein